MRATSRDVIATAFTLLIGVFVILAIYLFGTEIFKAGARFSISESSSGQGCACIGPTENGEMQCRGEMIKCAVCNKVAGYCSNAQKIDLENKTQTIIKRIIVKAGIFKPGGEVSGHTINIFADGIPLGNIIGDCMLGSPCSKDFVFEQPARIKQLEVSAESGYQLQNLLVYWSDR